jgi:hypothetical protein
VTTAALDLDVLLKDVPRGSWVAVSADRTRIVTYGTDLHEVVQNAKDSGEQNPIILRVAEMPGALIL